MTSLIDRTGFSPDGLRARPTVPPTALLDDATVRLRVDPVGRTWVALTLDGDDGSSSQGVWITSDLVHRDDGRSVAGRSVSGEV